MIRKLRSRLTYANVTSSLALFLVAAGGTAWASHELINSSDVVDNSLTSADIQNLTLTTNDYGIGSVFGSRIRDNGVLSSHIVDGTLTGSDLGADAIPADGGGSNGSTKIAPNAIRDNEIADGSLSRFDLFVETIVENETEIGDTFNNATCRDIPGGGSDTQAGDLPIVVGETLPAGTTVQGMRVVTPGTYPVRICNFSGANLAPPTNFVYSVLVVNG